MMSWRSLPRLLALIGATAAFLLIGGFFVFCASMPRAGEKHLQRALDAVAAIPVEERGIVVLTGGGGHRITEGLALGEKGIADRVLISGVHPQTTKADLGEMGATWVLHCCVDLGPRARTTKDNAEEAYAWLETHQYKAALLVTSDFHLPRARAELRSVAPDLVIVGVPVATPLAPEQGWMGRLTSWRLLGKEYLKFLVVRIRTAL